MEKSKGSEEIELVDLGNVVIEEDKIPESPENNHIIYKIFCPLQFLYLWVTPFVFNTFMNVITLNDIPKLKKNYRSMSYLKRFRIVRKKLPSRKALKLFLAVFFTFFVDFIFTAVLKIVNVVIRVGTPLVFKMVLTNLQDQIDPESIDRVKDILPENLIPTEADKFGNFRKDNTTIYYWFGGLMLLKLADAFFEPYESYVQNRLNMKIRGLLNCVVFEKAVKVTSKSSSQLTKGKILNFLNLDIDVVGGFMSRIHSVWTPVIMFFMSLFFLFSMVGYSTLIGLFIPFFISIPLFFIIGFFLLILRLRLLKLTDRRVNLMSHSFHEAQDSSESNMDCEETLAKLLKTRNQEVCTQRVMQFVIAIFFSLAKATPMFIIVVVVASHYFIKGEISEIVLYSSFGLFYNLSGIVIVPIIFIAYIIHFPSFARIDDLLQAEDAKDVDEKAKTIKDEQVVISLKNATFEREKPEDELREEEENNNNNNNKKKKKKKKDKKKEVFRLENLTLDVKNGSFVVITGPKGSGKTSFLHALLQDMDLVSGESCVCVPELSYVSQRPYIMCGSLLQNVTFFRNCISKHKKCDDEISKEEQVVDEGLLKKVLKKCELEGYSTDLNLGESSQKLSLREKFYVSFARCLYSSTKLVFVDDPLSPEYSGTEDTRGKVEKIMDLLLSVSLFSPDDSTATIFGRTLILTVDESRRRLLEAVLPHTTLLLQLGGQGRGGGVKFCGPPTERMILSGSMNPNERRSRINDDDDDDDDDDMLITTDSEFGSSEYSYDEDEENEDLMSFHSSSHGKTSSSGMSSAEMDLIIDSIPVSSSSDEDDIDINKIDLEEGGEEISSIITSSSSSDNSNEDSSSSSSMMTSESETSDDYEFKDDDNNIELNINDDDDEEEEELDQEQSIDLINPEERPTGTVPAKTILSLFRFMFPCRSLLLTFSAMFLLYTIDTTFRISTQWYVTNLTSGRYFHQKYGTYFNTTYYSNESLISQTTSYHYYNGSSGGSCSEEITDSYVINCHTEMVDIFWSRNFKNETIVQNGLSYQTSLGIFAILFLVNTGVSLVRVVSIANMFLTASNYFFTYIMVHLYANFKEYYSKLKNKKKETRIHNEDDNDDDDEDEEEDGKNKYFFLQQPVGRLVSRLSRDIGILDRGLGRSFDSVVSAIMTGFFTVILMCVTTYGLAVIPLCIVMPLYLLLFWVYHRSPRELKRIQSIARSRVYVSIDTAITGRAVIQAYGKCGMVTKQHCEKYVDVKNRVEFIKVGVSHWFWVNTDLMGLILFFGITMSSIILVYYFEVAYVFLLLAINYSASLAMFLGGFLFMVSTLETELNSLERVYFYFTKV